MKALTMLETLQSLLGVPACAIPLSICRITKPYLLDKVGIPTTGTAVLFAVPYLMTADVSAPHRNLSLYAVPRDYHGYMEALSHTLLPSLQRLYPHLRFALFADHSPLRETDAAARAGLGVLGRNGLLLTHAYGSFVFLGEVVTDGDYTTVTGEVPPDFPPTPPLCQGCGLCIRACPAGCQGEDHRGCLSALTQKKGALTPEEVSEIQKGGLVWGCDACQLACPHNQIVIREGRDTPIPYFREERSVCLSSEALLTMEDAAFRQRAYAWRGREVILRNCALLTEAHPDRKERSEP